jgi:hypothetical protein
MLRHRVPALAEVAARGSVINTHEDFAQPLTPWQKCQRLLISLQVQLSGAKCKLDWIVLRVVRFQPYDACAFVTHGLDHLSLSMQPWAVVHHHHTVALWVGVELRNNNLHEGDEKLLRVVSTFDDMAVEHAL